VSRALAARSRVMPRARCRRALVRTRVEHARTDIHHFARALSYPRPVSRARARMRVLSTDRVHVRKQDREAGDTQHNSSRTRDEASIKYFV
jgi:hypothetical protein